MKYAIFSILCLLLFSCGEGIEVNISEEKPVLLSPPDSLITTTQNQTFWWDTLEGADAYYLQIVSPNFDNVISLIDDQDLEDNTYNTTLSPGTYQWRVQAYNQAYTSEYAIRSIFIIQDTSQDLSAQTINLVSPSNQSESNNTNPDFLWQALSDADSYEIQVAQPDFTNSQFILLNTTSTSDNLIAPLNLSEGSYRWRVRGINSDSQTPWSEASFNIDLTGPSIPITVSPANCDTVAAPVLISWNSASDAVIDTLYIYSDSLITLVQQEALNSSSYTFNNSNGTYYWRVRSEDAAGNTSDYSFTSKFVIQ